MPKEKLYSVDLSPRFVAEFNHLDAKAQYKALNVIKKLMKDPYKGQNVEDNSGKPLVLEKITDERYFPKPDYN